VHPPQMQYTIVPMPIVPPIQPERPRLVRQNGFLVNRNELNGIPPM
jgi:hypothetical protein